MKKFTLSLSYAKSLAWSLFFCIPLASTAQVLFTQDFSSSAVLADYFNAVPTANQFDYIGPSGTAPASTIYFGTAATNPRLQFQRGNTAVGFARTTAFSPTPTVLKIKFKLIVPFCTANTGNMATFQVGAGFSPNATLETAEKVHSRITLSFPASATFLLRNTGVSPITESGNYTGEQIVTWYINNSGGDFSYTDPNGGNTPLVNNAADVWVGTTRIFIATPAITSDQLLTNFKFIFNNGSGAIGIDDIEISRLNTIIPVTLSSFTANKLGTANQLTWVTESEINNKGYDIQRQTRAGTWESLGFVKGVGKAATYNFEDKAPLSISYYRLRQVDFDGTETLSKVVSVSQTQKGYISISPNPATDKVRLTLSENEGFESAQITVYDLIGKQVLSQKTTNPTLELDMSTLAKGTYLIQIQANNSIYTDKIIRQ